MATAAAVLAEVGFEKATVRRIAEAAGILSGSLYHHFTSKEEIAVEILDHYMWEMISRYQAVADTESPPDVKLRAFIRLGIESIEEHRHAAMIMHNDWPSLHKGSRASDLDKGAREIERIWVELIEDGVKHGVLRNDVDPRSAYRAIVGGTLSTVRWYQPGGHMTIEQIADDYQRLFLDGYRTIG